MDFVNVVLRRVIGRVVAARGLPQLSSVAVERKGAGSEMEEGWLSFALADSCPELNSLACRALKWLKIDS